MISRLEEYVPCFRDQLRHRMMTVLFDYTCEISGSHFSPLYPWHQWHGRSTEAWTMLELKSWWMAKKDSLDLSPTTAGDISSHSQALQLQNCYGRGKKYSLLFQYSLGIDELLQSPKMIYLVTTYLTETIVSPPRKYWLFDAFLCFPIFSNVTHTISEVRIVDDLQIQRTRLLSILWEGSKTGQQMPCSVIPENRIKVSQLMSGVASHSLKQRDLLENEIRDF